MLKVCFQSESNSYRTIFYLRRYTKLFALPWRPCYYYTVILSFKNKGTEDIFNGKNTKEARKVCPESLWRIAARKLDLLDSVVELNELNIPPGNRLEALKGNRKGQYSIRINDKYRVCFTWTENGPTDVEIVDYHRG